MMYLLLGTEGLGSITVWVKGTESLASGPPAFCEEI